MVATNSEIRAKVNIACGLSFPPSHRYIPLPFTIEFLLLHRLFSSVLRFCPFSLSCRYVFRIKHRKIVLSHIQKALIRMSQTYQLG